VLSEQPGPLHSHPRKCVLPDTAIGSTHAQGAVFAQLSHALAKRETTIFQAIDFKGLKSAGVSRFW